MRIISLTNQKGGCAKTTTAVNLAAGLALAGKRVLLIDMDPQANASSVFSEPNNLEKTISSILFENMPPAEVIIHTSLKNLSLLPSDIELSGADLKLSNIIGREKLLLHKITPILNSYDYLIIDTPPSLGLLTVNALTTSNEVLIPISTSFFAMKGVKMLEETIKLIKQNLDHPKLNISGVLCTMYDPITNVSKTALAMIKDYFHDKVMKTIIHRNIKLEEAHSAGKSIFEYDTNCIGAKNYHQLTQEVLGHERHPAKSVV